MVMVTNCYMVTIRHTFNNPQIVTVVYAYKPLNRAFAAKNELNRQLVCAFSGRLGG